MQATLSKANTPSDLSPKEKGAFERRNVIYTALGHNAAVTTFYLPLKQSDRFLLLSDGIHDNLTTDEIKQLIMDNPHDSTLVKQLTTAARQRARSRHFRAKSDDMTAGVITYRMSPVTQIVADHNARLDARQSSR